MKETFAIAGIFRSDLQITSKETALEFYNGVRNVILIRERGDLYLRIEPGNHISHVTREEVDTGAAAFVPAMYDPYGNIAYRHRKYINQYLRRE